MDEPFSQVDALTAENLRSEVVRFWSDHASNPKTIFMVSHDVKEVVFMATRIVVMAARPGRVRRIFENKLPYPRDYRAPAFQRLVDEIHGVITEAEIPDAPAAAPTHAQAKAQPRTQVWEPLPDAGPGEIFRTPGDARRPRRAGERVLAGRRSRLGVREGSLGGEGRRAAGPGRHASAGRRPDPRRPAVSGQRRARAQADLPAASRGAAGYSATCWSRSGRRSGKSSTRTSSSARLRSTSPTRTPTGSFRPWSPGVATRICSTTTSSAGSSTSRSRPRRVERASGDRGTRRPRQCGRRDVEVIHRLKREGPHLE